MGALEFENIEIFWCPFLEKIEFEVSTAFRAAIRRLIEIHEVRECEDFDA